MGYLSRLPTSNDPPRSTSGEDPWLGDNELMDRYALVLNGLAKKCVKCGRMTHINNLDIECFCPDCRQPQETEL